MGVNPDFRLTLSPFVSSNYGRKRQQKVAIDMIKSLIKSKFSWRVNIEYDGYGYIAEVKAWRD